MTILDLVWEVLGALLPFDWPARRRRKAPRRATPLDLTGRGARIVMQRRSRRGDR